MPATAPHPPSPARIFGDQRPAQLAQRLGVDSFYVYARHLIANRVAELRTALPARMHVHYAIKANPFSPLVCFMAGQVDGFDVASSTEMQLALDAGMPAQRISFAGPGKTENDLRQALAAGILINIESEREAETLSRLSQETGLPARVALRINPAFELKRAGMRMGGGARPFGIDEESAPLLLRRLSSLGLAFEGFHIYAGSQNLQGAEIAAAQEQSYTLATRLAADAPAPVKHLNLGGGFGIPYFAGEVALDLQPIVAALATISADAARTMPEAQLNLELGRYLVGEAGAYVTRIIDKKQSRGTNYLITAGGMNHHLAASGNLGQVIRKNYPTGISQSKQSDEQETVTISGPLCTPLDMLAENVTLPVAEVGDYVVIFQSGAYGASASPQGFLSHSRPAETLI